MYTVNICIFISNISADSCILHFQPKCIANNSTRLPQIAVINIRNIFRT